MDKIYLWKVLASTASLIVLVALARGSHWQDLLVELRAFPVYSAETIRAKEAEFIRDWLPKRFPLWIAALAVLAFGGVAWWLAH
jgi:hypothetical protein